MLKKYIVMGFGFAMGEWLFGMTYKLFFDKVEIRVNKAMAAEATSKEETKKNDVPMGFHGEDDDNA